MRRESGARHVTSRERGPEAATLTSRGAPEGAAGRGRRMVRKVEMRESKCLWLCYAVKCCISAAFLFCAMDGDALRDEDDNKE